jgi:hypothetical protein
LIEFNFTIALSMNNCAFDSTLGLRDLMKAMTLLRSSSAVRPVHRGLSRIISIKTPGRLSIVVSVSAE